MSGVTNLSVSDLEVFGNLRATSFLDVSGTPGNATANTVRGRAAIAGAASTCVITNSLVTAASTVLVTKETNDATATSFLSVVPGAGSFTVTANAGATGTTKFSWVVIN